MTIAPASRPAVTRPSRTPSWEWVGRRAAVGAVLREAGQEEQPREQSAPTREARGASRSSVCDQSYFDAEPDAPSFRCPRFHEVSPWIDRRRHARAAGQSSPRRARSRARIVERRGNDDRETRELRLELRETALRESDAVRASITAGHGDGVEVFASRLHRRAVLAGLRRLRGGGRLDRRPASAQRGGLALLRLRGPLSGRRRHVVVRDVRPVRDRGRPARPAGGGVDLRVARRGRVHSGGAAPAAVPARSLPDAALARGGRGGERTATALALAIAFEPGGL